MSIASEITRLQGAKSDLKTSIEGKGVTVPSATKIDGYAALVDQIQQGGGGIVPDVVDAVKWQKGSNAPIADSDVASNIMALPLSMKLDVFATTIYKNANTTENYATNDHIRLLGSDNKEYTLAEWNVLFVANNYSIVGMPDPVAVVVDKASGGKEALMWNERFTGQIANTKGSSLLVAGRMQHSIYNAGDVGNIQSPITATTGTDSITGKGYEVVDGGTTWIYKEANTKQQFTAPKNARYVIPFADSNIFDEWTDQLYAHNEWVRHRFAIDSGVTTTEINGTMGDVGIFNSSGIQAAVNEDMYFFVRASANDVWHSTGLLAKYNITPALNATYATTIYQSQISNGINMNDTGINSSAKPILVPGAKGAEAIAVDGKWYIITPLITYPGGALPISDSPAVYYCKAKGLKLPSTELLYRLLSQNYTIYDALRSYLTNVEGRSLVAHSNTGIWAADRNGSGSAVYVMSLPNTVGSYVTNNTLATDYTVIPSKRLS